MEWQQLSDAVKPSFLSKLVTAVTPFSGLTSNALAHLRRVWINFYDDHVRIVVPSRASCNSLKLQGGDQDNLPIAVARSEPCWYCSNHGDTDGFENNWQGSPGHEPEEQTVILDYEIAEPAVNILEMVFHTHNRPELGATPSGIHKAGRMAANTSDPDTHQYGKFIRTGPVLYRYYGLEPSEIASLTPYTENVIKQIIRATPHVHLDQFSTTAFLRLLADYEPTAVTPLAKKVEIQRQAVEKRLKRLKARDRVTATNTGRAGPPAKWKTTVPWNKPFYCDHCDFESHSLNALSKHENREHPSSS